MDDLQLAVSKLRALSPRLNVAVDQANRVVHQVEALLEEECQLAVQAEVPVTYNDKGVAVQLLRYARVDGRYRIALTNTDGDARFITRTWAECDRSEKLSSFPALPKLLMAVAKALEAQINSTTATATTVTQIVSALQQQGLCGDGDAKPDAAPKPLAEAPAKLPEPAKSAAPELPGRSRPGDDLTINEWLKAIPRPQDRRPRKVEVGEAKVG